MNTREPRIGVIGGSGLYSMQGLEVHDEVELETPYGAPSDRFVLGEVDGAPVAFLARHRRGHHYPPGDVPYRANIYGFKLLANLFSVSAVGSLRERIQPLHMVVPDQFVDRTRNRKVTFAEPGAVIHVTMADPVCARLSALLVSAAAAEDVVAHDGGTYLCIDGPQFSTRAESHMYRALGMDVIGMTNASEARLAREAGIGYATLAMACDYDCWHDHHEDVTAEMALGNLRASVENAQRVLRRAIHELPVDEPSSCGDASRALLQEPASMPADVWQRLSVLFENKSFDEAEEPE
jgi:5'-methylthioadenosine phosphorylase